MVDLAGSNLRSCFAAVLACVFIASGTSSTIVATVRILRLDSDVEHHRKVTDELMRLRVHGPEHRYLFGGSCGAVSARADASIGSTCCATSCSLCCASLFFTSETFRSPPMRFSTAKALMHVVVQRHERATVSKEMNTPLRTPAQCDSKPLNAKHLLKSFPPCRLRESGSLTGSSCPLRTAQIQMSFRMATTRLPASRHNSHRLLRRILEKTSTMVTTT